jgi:uncharacterized BrkB/YihY/UPF0761 family membrane protein
VLTVQKDPIPGSVFVAFIVVSVLFKWAFSIYKGHFLSSKIYAEVHKKPIRSVDP